MTSTLQTAVQVPLRTSACPLDAATGRVRAVILSRHSLRIVLGILWLLDGALQLQSFMFSTGFAKTIIAPAASGQPFLVSGPVEWNARLIASHPIILNGLFASVQLALGLGLLFRRTARLALVSSVGWAVGVWYLGEGLGGLAGGHVTALLGAPGAALFYAVLALAVWPGSVDVISGVDSSRSTRPPRWILKAWMVLWAGFATLNLLPPNISSRSISSQLTTNASTVPSWLAAIDRAMGSAVHGLGGGAVVLTVTLELAIGLLVLRQSPLRAVAVWAGIAISGLYWAVGQSFGQLFSGQATDPSTGPLLILLGLAALGAAGRSGTQTQHVVVSMHERQPLAA